MQLNIKAFALTCGFLWGVGLFFLTWWLILLEGDENHKRVELEVDIPFPDPKLLDK